MKVLIEFKEYKDAAVHIYVPLTKMNQHKLPMLSSPPETWVSVYKQKMESWNPLLQSPFKENEILLRAHHAYFDVLQSMLTANIFATSEVSVIAGVGKVRIEPLNPEMRSLGGDWTYLGYTMTGQKRIASLQSLLEDVFKNNITGAVIETGVWRGGTSMFARGVMRAYQQRHRILYVCDSFRGLPPGQNQLDREINWSHMPYLEISHETVARNFAELRLLDQHVVFAKGFFNDTMPKLRPMVDEIAILRLDGDMYQSTNDVLYHMYHKVSVECICIHCKFKKCEINNLCLQNVFLEDLLFQITYLKCRRSFHE